MRKNLFVEITVIFILLVVLFFIVAGLIVSEKRHEKLQKILCDDAKDYGYPSWFVQNGEYLNYAFVGYSSLTSDEVINGRKVYNYRNATKSELTNRFIKNKFYFVYSDNEISNRQIEDFKKTNFWNKYQNSGMTFKCDIRNAI